MHLPPISLVPGPSPSTGPSRRILTKLLQTHDLAISLVPYVHHTSVIQAAIKSKFNVVTTSYFLPAIRELEKAIKETGIVVRIVGPGFDHVYAIKTIDEVHTMGGKVKEFHPYCGGLPARECANNILGFKFSSSQRGAIMSQLNSAPFISNEKQVDISTKDLMANAKPYFVMDDYDFAAYPNRNPVPFRELYNIPEGETVVRGSLWYEGNEMLIKALADMGWLDAGKKG